MHRRAFVVMILVLGASCASGSTEPSDGGSSNDAGTGAVGPTFAEVDAIFENRCVNCHMAAGPDSFLDLSSPDEAYAELVNVVATGPDCNVTRHVRVVPGDAEASLLFAKVAGTEDCGGRMPAPFERLPQPPPIPVEEQQTIHAWIQAGARR